MPAQPQAANDSDRTRGLYNKFFVQRRSGTPHKHDDCFYFVLDLDHDRFAGPALDTYINACASEYPTLARDLRAQLVQKSGIRPHSRLRAVRVEIVYDARDQDNVDAALKVLGELVGDHREVVQMIGRGVPIPLWAESIQAALDEEET